MSVDARPTQARFDGIVGNADVAVDAQPRRLKGES